MLGFLASAAVVLLSLAFIALWEFGRFNGWVAFFGMSFIPLEIVTGVIWAGKPLGSGRVPQPWRGMLLMALTLAAGLVVSRVVYATLGDSQGEPGPMLVFFCICVIVTTFFWTIALGGWPFTRLAADQTAAGLATWLSCYGAGSVIYWVCCDFAFLKGTPVYVPSADPHGLFDAWNVVVCYMSALTVMFAWVCLDMWPLTAGGRRIRQPVLGLVVTASSVAIGYAMFAIAVGPLGVQNVEFLLRVPVAFIFGTILVLNMFENTLAPARQPLKGVVNIALAATLGSVLLAGYQWLEGAVSGPLPPGPDAFRREQLQVWTANALLAVTFPLLVFYSGYFDFWPLRRTSVEPKD